MTTARAFRGFRFPAQVILGAGRVRQGGVNSTGPDLDFGHSGREAGGLGEAVEDGAGDFRNVGVIR